MSTASPPRVRSTSFPARPAPRSCSSAAPPGARAPTVSFDEDLPFEELPALYRAADVVVLPYRAEGFCLPAVEAMACGVPVIHNGEGPTAEFVADIGGWA